MSTVEQATEPTEASASAPGTQASTEADFLVRLNAAETAMNVASKRPHGNGTELSSEDWWRSLAEAGDVVATVYEDAANSGLWEVGSFMWAVLTDARWFAQQQAKADRHEADLIADRAKARTAERAS